MYNRDVNEIQGFVKWCGTDAFVNTGLFVLLTIQAGLSTVKGSMAKVNFEGEDANCLWGKKGDGYTYLKDNADYLYGKMYDIADKKGYNSVEACADVVQLFMQVPNLGMVKASFLAQCLGFNVACIDSHNIKRLGLNPNVVKTPPASMKPATVRKKVEAYVVLTQEKGSQYWWDTWCEYVAGNRANRALDTGDVVSRFHVECITYGFEGGW
jgi:hypothetical protein|tara:strand:- start:7564 stop:8196 length:633 start_codon:yes stop_codon:yes gene_type:complete